MITGDQIACHLVGDYILQSDWMANEKTKGAWPALVHATTYALPFLFLTRSGAALSFIVATHFAIDHWRLARYLCWAKNFVAPRSYWYAWRNCRGTGYHSERPQFMAVWLMIIADNTLHLLCNGLALRYL